MGLRITPEAGLERAIEECPVRIVSREVLKPLDAEALAVGSESFSHLFAKEAAKS